MRKKIKPDKICPKCGTRLKFGEEAVFCDVCKERVGTDYPLKITIFWEDCEESAKDVEVCSWKCVKEFLQDFPFDKKKVNFINLPYISNYSTGNFESELEGFLKVFMGVDKK